MSNLTYMPYDYEDFVKVSVSVKLAFLFIDFLVTTSF